MLHAVQPPLGWNEEVLAIDGPKRSVAFTVTRKESDEVSKKNTFSANEDPSIGPYWVGMGLS